MKNIVLRQNKIDLKRNYTQKININVISFRVIAASIVTTIGAMIIYSQSTISGDCIEAYAASKNYETASKLLEIFIYVLLPCLLAWAYRVTVYNFPHAPEISADIMRIFKIRPVFFSLLIAMKRALPARTLVYALSKIHGALCALNRFSTNKFKFNISNRFLLFSRYIGDIDGTRFAVGLGTAYSYASFAAWIGIIFTILGPSVREFSTPGALAHAREAAKYCAALSGNPLNFTPIDPFKDNALALPYSMHPIAPTR